MKIATYGMITLDEIVPIPCELALSLNSNPRFPATYGGYGCKPGTTAMIEAWSIPSGDKNACLGKSRFIAKPTAFMKNLHTNDHTIYKETFNIPPDSSRFTGTPRQLASHFLTRA